MSTPVSRSQPMTGLPIIAEGSIPSEGCNCFWLKDSDGRTFGDIYGPQSSPVQQAFAVLIVEAVNNYEQAKRDAQNFGETMCATNDRLLAAQDDISSLKARIEELEGALSTAREALEFYADPFAWKKKHDPEDVVRIPDFYSETSFGDTAIEALQSLPEVRK